MADDLFGFLNSSVPHRLTAPAGYEGVHKDGMSWPIQGSTPQLTSWITVGQWTHVMGQFRGLDTLPEVDMSDLLPTSPLLLREFITRFTTSVLTGLNPGGYGLLPQSGGALTGRLSINSGADATTTIFNADAGGATYWQHAGVGVGLLQAIDPHFYIRSQTPNGSVFVGTQGLTRFTVDNSGSSVFAGSAVPAVDSTYSSGQAANAWLEVHADKVLTDTFEDRSAAESVDAADIVHGTARSFAHVTNGGSAVLVKDYNVASVSRISIGVVRVTFSNAMPNANYAAIPGSHSAARMASITAKTTTYVEVTTYTFAGVLEDRDFSVEVLGD